MQSEPIAGREGHPSPLTAHVPDVTDNENRPICEPTPEASSSVNSNTFEKSIGTRVRARERQKRARGSATPTNPVGSAVSRQ